MAKRADIGHTASTEGRQQAFTKFHEQIGKPALTKMKKQLACIMGQPGLRPNSNRQLRLHKARSLARHAGALIILLFTEVVSSIGALPSKFGHNFRGVTTICLVLPAVAMGLWRRSGRALKQRITGGQRRPVGCIPASKRGSVAHTQDIWAHVA